MSNQYGSNLMLNQGNTPAELQMNAMLMEDRVRNQMEASRDPRNVQLNRIRQEHINQEMRIQQENLHRDIIASQLRNQDVQNQLAQRNRFASYQNQLARLDNRLQTDTRNRARTFQEEYEMDLHKYQRSSGN